MNQLTPNLDHMEPALRPLALPVAEIRADEQNCRQHDRRNLTIIRQSLEAFGQQKPIVVDAQGRCVAGNGTLAAARELGWTHIAAVRTRLQGSAAQAYAIVDNRATDMSTWDELQLAQTLAHLQNDEEFPQGLSGFDDAEIERCINASTGLAAAELPEVPIDDLYQVLVQCRDEAQQRTLFTRLTEEGWQCRVLTL